MGMTIDQSINQIIDSLIGEKANLLNHSDRVALTDALNTMRKYQKIQEIVRWNNAPSPYYKPDGQLFREICEVLEDGKID